MTALVLLLFLIALFLGTPLYIVLFGLSAYLFTTVDQLPLISSVISFQRLQTQDFISAIPLFTFAGYVLAKSKSPDRIIKLFNHCFSFFKGAESVMVVVILAFFTALTGASGVSILALGGLMYPLLKERGQSEKFSLGLITSSGSIGLLFAPSLPVILYGVVASQNMSGMSNVDINTLFTVALIPSVILISTVIIYSLVTGRGTSPASGLDWQKVRASLWAARYEIPLPFIVYGGIYSGFFTVMEAALVTAIYVFVVVFFLYKDLSLKGNFFGLVTESMKLSGGIFIIMATASVLTNYLVDQEIPKKVFEAISPIIQDKVSFLLMANVFLLLSGCLLDIFSAILILLPIMIPIVEQYGINPYHFAIIFLVNLEIGYLTPPVGMNLFIASYRFKKKITELYKASLPFLLLMIVVLLCITYIPGISTFLLKTDEKEGAMDLRAPSKVAEIELIDAGPNSVRIKFLPSTDDDGEIVAYLIRYLDTPIATEDDFDFAYDIPDLPASQDQFEIKDLSPGVKYYISIRAQDGAGHLSELTSFEVITSKI